MLFGSVFFDLYIVIEYTGTLRRRAVSCLNTGSILELAGAYSCL